MPDNAADHTFFARVAPWLLAAGLLWMGQGLARADGAAAPHIDAARLYQQHCAACHGSTRTGGMGPALLPESLERLRKKDALDVVQHGRAATQMAGFAQQLLPEEINAVVDWIYQPVVLRPPGVTPTFAPHASRRLAPKTCLPSPNGAPTR